jgi:dolichyl-phosphate beta-glucosyltransferase
VRFGSVTAAARNRVSLPHSGAPTPPDEANLSAEVMIEAAADPCAPVPAGGEVPPGPSSESRRGGVTLEVVIPARNEERRLPETLEVLCDYLAGQSYTASIVVVDNGSVDRTPDIVSDWPKTPVNVHLVGCSTPGKGAAVRRGVLTSTADFIGFMDADLATPVDTLDRVMPLLRQGNPIVVGSRRCAGAAYEAAQPLTRRICGEGFRRLARSVVDNVHDTQCGFKFFRGDVARTLFAACQINGFAFDLEVLAIAQRSGCPAIEIPVRWTARDGSTLRLATHGREIARELANIRHTVRRLDRSRHSEMVSVRGALAG